MPENPDDYWIEFDNGNRMRVTKPSSPMRGGPGTFYGSTPELDAHAERMIRENREISAEMDALDFSRPRIEGKHWPTGKPKWRVGPFWRFVRWLRGEME